MGLLDRFRKKGPRQKAPLDRETEFLAHLLLVKKFWKEGRAQLALVGISRAIELNPSSSEAYYIRAGIYYWMGVYDSAIDDYNKAIDLDPKDALFYLGRGRAYLEKGELDKAIADFTRALQLDPKLPRAFYERGNAYFKRGEALRKVQGEFSALGSPAEKTVHEYLQLAILDYSRAISLDPKFVAAYANRGTVYHFLYREAEARKDFEAVLTLSRDKAFVEYAKKRLVEMKAVPDVLTSLALVEKLIAGDVLLPIDRYFVDLARQHKPGSPQLNREQSLALIKRILEADTLAQVELFSVNLEQMGKTFFDAMVDEVEFAKAEGRRAAAIRLTAYCELLAYLKVNPRGKRALTAALRSLSRRGNAPP